MADQQLNQVDLAKKSGVAQPAISSYLRRSRKGQYPTYPTLVKLAVALRCDLYDLTGLEELKGIVEPPKLPDPEAEALWEIYKSLPNGDTVKELLRQRVKEFRRLNKEKEDTL